MSKLEDLIAKLCPNGVEYKKIGDIATDVFRGSGIKKDQVTSTGIPCVRYGEIYTKYNLWFDSCFSHTSESLITNKKYFEHGDILFAITGESVEDIAKSCAYVGNEKCLAGGDIVVVKHNQNPKYLSYALSTTDARLQKSSGKVKSKVVHASTESIKGITIPIPPLDVQAEIVRILDTFTELTTKLTENLTAELTTRKKQYEYYRDALLTFDDNNPLRSLISRYCPNGVEYKKIGDIATDVFRGSGIKKDQVTSTGIPCVRYGEIYTKYNLWFDSCFSHTSESLITNKKYFEHGDILFAITGESVEDIAKSCAYVGNEKCLAGGDIVVVKHNQNPKYLSYALSTTNARLQKSSGKVKSKVVHASTESIKGITIPIPPLEVQHQIVQILDRFDSLCNDLTKGLPAEIEARRKQYEYYRNQLLTFKRA